MAGVRGTDTSPIQMDQNRQPPPTSAAPPTPGRCGAYSPPAEEEGATDGAAWPLLVHQAIVCIPTPLVTYVAMVTQKLVDCLIWIQHNANASPLLSVEARRREALCSSDMCFG